MSDFILEKLMADNSEMFSDETAVYEEAYGLGSWPLATLTDVKTFAASDKGFGYVLGLVLNLKGADGEMAYTGRINLPQSVEENGDADNYEYALNRETKKGNVVNRLLAGLGFAKTLKGNIDDEAHYNALADIFYAHIGNLCPVKITEDGRNVKGEIDANGKQKWEFVANGFSRCDGLKPRKR